jgi:hypothetical protein
MFLNQIKKTRQKPPTRHELMASFTGFELASLIEVGCIIGSHAVFDAELESQVS